jgi:hypothetical protein
VTGPPLDPIHSIKRNASLGLLRVHDRGQAMLVRGAVAGPQIAIHGLRVASIPRCTPGPHGHSVPLCAEAFDRCQGRIARAGAERRTWGTSPTSPTSPTRPDEPDEPDQPDQPDEPDEPVLARA